MRDQVNEAMDRRGFLGRSMLGAGMAMAARFGAAEAKAASAANPFTMDLQRLSKTDPRLVRYDEVRRFVCPMKGARRLSLAARGRLLVAGDSGVGILEADGRVVRTISTASPAGCVTADDHDNLLVGLRDHVVVFDLDGAPKASWPKFEGRAWLTGIAVAEDRVFLADAGRRMILSCDREGRVQGQIGVKDKERSIPGLSVPSPYLDVKVGPDRLLRVNNFGRHRVEAYTFEGDLEQSWGKPGAGIAGFCGCCNPVSIALLPDGGYVTCEKGLARVKVYSGTGEFVGVVAGPESFPEHARATDASSGKLDAATDPEGKVYVLDPLGGTIRIYQPKAA